MPLVAFVLLAIICLALLGFACACLSDQPMQAIDRALSGGQAVPALVVWTLAVAALLGASLLLAVRHGRDSRASPALLQRFLF